MFEPFGTKLLRLPRFLIWVLEFGFWILDLFFCVLECDGKAMGGTETKQIEKNEKHTE